MSNEKEGFSTPVSLTAHKYRHLHHGTASRLSRTPVLCVPKVTFNDDEAERRERRLRSNLVTMLSPGCGTPRSAVHSSAKRSKTGIESVTSAVSNTQLKEHYANCIKLSTQNKINAKNAFGLHLIDHMLQLLTIQGEMTNFQVASSTLDASAKIYAGRVDSIYTDAYKVLTGFGRDSQNNAADNAEGENEGEEDERAKAAGKPKKAPSSGVNKVLEKNIRNLNMNTLDLEYQADPLFKKTSAAFDEGGVEGLLINHLHTDAGFLLSLDSDEVPGHRDQPVSHSVNVPLEDIRKIISHSQVRSRQLCPTFSGVFSDTDKNGGGWSIDQAASRLGKTSPSQATDIGAEYSMLPCPQSVPDLTLHEDEGEDPGPVGVEQEMSPPQEAADLTILGSDNKMAGFIPTSGPIQQADNPDGEGPLGPLVLSEALQVSEYSYFAPSLLATWAGPKHWKLQPKSSESGSDKDEKRKRKRLPSAVFSIDFSQTPDEAMLSTGKASVQLSKPVLARRNSTNTTLPENPNTKASVLHKLFSRPKWEVRRRRRATVPQVEEQLEGDWYDYGNLHDNANFCPQVEEDTDGEMDIGGDPLSQEGAFFPETQEEQSQPAGADLMLAGDNLVPQPRMVQQIHIEYARTAKRLDVKKLKGKMWDLLNTEQSSSTSGDEVKDVECSRLNFSAMCSALPSQLSNEMKKNISVPICFVCLLHLANEKCLDITGTDDLTDLEIGT